MKKYFFSCFVVLAVNSAAVAATDAPVAEAGFAPVAIPAIPMVGGFTGPGPGVTSARNAATMRDDTPVVLRGHIVQHLGGEKYIFKDASGTIRVDIDHDRWPPQPITPNNLVELRGEIDRDWHSVEVDVDWVIVLQ